MTEPQAQTRPRVSDRELKRLCDEVYFHHHARVIVALDLRDCRAERDALAARVAELEQRAGQTWTAESGSDSTTEYHPPRESGAAPPISLTSENISDLEVNAYEAGARDMRERAADFVSGFGLGAAFTNSIYRAQAVDAIRALPIDEDFAT